MRLHENIKLFKESVNITSLKLDIPDVYVEKDYWVTFAIRQIFNSEVAENVVFKGGTALLKCFELIERFSEDIDLVIIRSGNESSNQLTTKIRKIGKIVSKSLPEIIHEKLTNKKGNIRKTVHTYTKLFEGEYFQAHSYIVVEATWLGYFEPYTNAKVSSFIYQMMKDADQIDLAQEYEMEPFDVLVLKPERTLCEKIMSLVRFSYTEDPMTDLGLKIRHCYDLTKMLENAELSAFFDSNDFDKMLLKVANDDIVSFKNNNQWLKYRPEQALIFSEAEKVWSELKKIYNSGFRNMVFGDLPDEREVFQAILKIRERVKHIEWSI